MYDVCVTLFNFLLKQKFGSYPNLGNIRIYIYIYSSYTNVAIKIDLKKAVDFIDFF